MAERGPARIVWTAASCEKSICPTTVSAPLWHSGPTADGTKERLATAERAQCCTCGCGEDSSPARGPMAPASGRTCFDGRADHSNAWLGFGDGARLRQNLPEALVG